MSTAAELKDEGNKLFVAKKYGQASRKYSDAIAKDASNAVLYANRAACALNLQNYGDAAKDATKSTQLDPGYSKAWARLATAQQGLNDLKGCMLSWSKAIDTLPANPSPAEATQKEQYRINWGNAIKAQQEWECKNANAGTPSPIIILPGTQMPWDVAAEMIPALTAQGPPGYKSSAWIIHGAHADWTEGLRIMDKMIVRGNQCQAFRGSIESLSNAVMVDDRIFQVRDQEFFNKYNQQMMSEVATVRAWSSGEASEVIREAPSRLAKEGWETLRGALSLTVRGYALKGFMLSGAMRDYDKAEWLMSESVKICEWGAKKWAKVHFDDKGVIFRPSFMVGLKSMRLEAYMQDMATQRGGSRRFNLEEFYELAKELKRESVTQERTVDNMSPSFIQAFYLYPEVRATTCIGMYHKLCSNIESGSAALEHRATAAKHYLEAADLLPQDEEMHPYFLNTALGCLFDSNQPLKVTLPIMQRIREATPKMQKLWVNSALQRGGRDLILDRTAKIEQGIWQRIASGELTMESRYAPPNFEGPPRR